MRTFSASFGRQAVPELTGKVNLGINSMTVPKLPKSAPEKRPNRGKRGELTRAQKSAKQMSQSHQVGFATRGFVLMLITTV